MAEWLSYYFSVIRYGNGNGHRVANTFCTLAFERATTGGHYVQLRVLINSFRAGTDATEPLSGHLLNFYKSSDMSASIWN